MSDKNLPAIIESAAIAQKIDLNKVNLLLPTQTFGQVVGQFDKVTLEVVTVDPNPKNGDVYEPSRGKYALGKRPLNAIANAVGIVWNTRETTVIESTERKARAKATGAIRKANGEWLPLTDEKSVDLDAIEEKQRISTEEDAEKGRLHWENGQKAYAPWTNEKQKLDWTERTVRKAMIQYRLFKDERAMTGAIERLVKQCLALKSTFTAGDLQKPFAFPRVTLDADKMLQDPELRQAVIDRAAGSANAIFGPPAHIEERNVTPDREALPAPTTDGKPNETDENGSTAEPEQQQFPGLPADDEIPGFDKPPVEPTEVEQLRSWFEMRIGEVAAKETKDWIKDFLDGKAKGKDGHDIDSQNLETLQMYKARLEEKLADAGGAK